MGEPYGRAPDRRGGGVREGVEESPGEGPVHGVHGGGERQGGRGGSGIPGGTALVQDMSAV